MGTAKFQQHQMGMSVHCMSKGKVLGDTKCLSDLLQSPNSDVLRVVHLIEVHRQTFDEFRNEENHELWNTVV